MNFFQQCRIDIQGKRISHGTGSICQPFGAEVRHRPELCPHSCSLPRLLVGKRTNWPLLVKEFRAVTATCFSRSSQCTCATNSRPRVSHSSGVQRVRLNVSLRDCTAPNVSGCSSLVCDECFAGLHSWDVSLCGICTALVVLASCLLSAATSSVQCSLSQGWVPLICHESQARVFIIDCPHLCLTGVHWFLQVRPLTASFLR